MVVAYINDSWRTDPMTQTSKRDPDTHVDLTEVQADESYDDASAVKRRELGLTPHRPTAKAAPMRPPKRLLTEPQTRLLAVQIVAIAAVTALLILAKLVNSPTNWAQVRANVSRLSPFASPSQMAPGELSEQYRLLLEDDFSSGTPILVESSVPGQYVIGHVAADGVYRMRVWPNSLAWSSLGETCKTPIVLTTVAAVAAETPFGYAALLGRYRDTASFYLFAIDGQGQYAVRLRKDDQWITLRDWTPLLTLQRAGTANSLMLEDDGESLRFQANEELLFETSEPQLPFGGTGLAGGAQSEFSEINFDQFQLYASPCGEP